MCWALLAADLEDFASLEGIDAVGFFGQVCVCDHTHRMCTFKKLSMITQEGMLVLVSRSPCCAYCGVC